MTNTSQLIAFIDQHQAEILQDWLREQTAIKTTFPRINSRNDLEDNSTEFLRLLRQVSATTDIHDVTAPAWREVREFLERLSSSRAEQGFSPSETAIFIFSIKQPLFTVLRREFEQEPGTLADMMWTATLVIDNLGLYTTEVYQKTRDRVISRQKQEIYELSTPVVQLWDQILAVPLIGTLDSARTQLIMENVLNKIVQTSSRIIIIDITGVPVVDTLVAQYILKTAQATRLMGAECFISGISPQIAQTIVHLGISLNDLVSRATLKEAFALALKRLSVRVSQDF